MALSCWLCERALVWVMVRVFKEGFAFFGGVKPLALRVCAGVGGGAGF